MNTIQIYAIFICLIGVSAIVGGYQLIITGGSGMPVDWLSGSSFTSYFWPGVILMCVVGGTHLLATILLWKQAWCAPESLAVAGYGLLIWIFVEIYITHQSSWLQVVYFALGVQSLVITMWLMRYDQWKKSLGIR